MVFWKASKDFQKEVLDLWFWQQYLNIIASIPQMIVEVTGLKGIMSTQKEEKYSSACQLHSHWETDPWKNTSAPLSFWAFVSPYRK